ncbi:MAG: hypothetical protein WBG37_20440, partial [Desulfobacterales bacterium]
MSKKSQIGNHGPQHSTAPEVDFFGLTFFQVPAVKGPSAVWAASHQALWRLIRRHQRDLRPCQGVAIEIRQQLAALFPLLDAVCRRTCPWCPDPCCIVTTVWYDFIDLLFLHFIETPLPPAPLADRLD